MNHSNVAADGNLAGQLALRVRITQIITLALVAGIVAFAGFAIFTGGAAQPAPPAAAPPQPAQPMLSLMSVGLLALCSVMSLVVPRILDKSPVKAAAATSQAMLDALLQKYQARHVVRVALLEGPAMLALVGYLVEHHMWVLAVPGISVALMLAAWPTLDKATQWLAKVSGPLQG